jgi:hypothetical protein
MPMLFWGVLMTTMWNVALACCDPDWYKPIR